MYLLLGELEKIRKTERCVNLNKTKTRNFSFKLISFALHSLMGWYIKNTISHNI